MIRPETADKALRLTAAFEGHGGGYAAGDFDGQVLTWGYLGFALKSGSLYRVLRRIADTAPAILPAPFVQAIKAWHGATIEYVRINILDPSNKDWVRQDWQRTFVWLYSQPAAQAAMRAEAQGYLNRGAIIAREFGFRTERGFCLAFDIAVQNGSVTRRARELFAQNDDKNSPEEWRRLKAMAQAVAAASSSRWVGDVLSRKLTIAVGEGRVHGRTYNLKDFGIRYDIAWEVDAA